MKPFRIVAVALGGVTILLLAAAPAAQASAAVNVPCSGPAGGLPGLLWAIGHAVTALAARVAADVRRPRHYLAGRLDSVQITTVIDGQDELLVTLTTSGTQAPGSPLAGVFSITAHDCSLGRVKRWQHEHTPLRAYLSHDGAIMLADPALGGNAPCAPPPLAPGIPTRRQLPKTARRRTAHNHHGTTHWPRQARSQSPRKGRAADDLCDHRALHRRQGQRLHRRMPGRLHLRRPPDALHPP